MKKLPRNKCLICENETKRSTTKYCSIECRGISHRGIRQGGPEIIYPPIECPGCMKNFKPHRGKQKYCSKTCAGNIVQKEHMSKLGKAKLGKLNSEESKKKQSESMKGKLVGKLNPMYGKKAAHGKGYWHITWENKKVFLRSSWELGFAKYLDSKQIRYEVESKRFPITYEYEGLKKEGTYCPDFYLPDKNKYYEVKGWWRDDAKVKFEAFKSQYLNIQNTLVNTTFLKKLKIKNIRLK